MSSSMIRFNFLLDEDTYNLLKELAEAEHETLSNYLRRLIRKQAAAKEA